MKRHQISKLLKQVIEAARQRSSGHSTGRPAGVVVTRRTRGNRLPAAPPTARETARLGDTLRFATSVAAGETPNTKPAPDPYLAAVRRLGVELNSLAPSSAPGHR